MMRRGVVGGSLLELTLLLFAMYGMSPAQFTQGPRGNPSAAGITTGTQAPAPAPPHVVAPSPSGLAPSSGPVITGMQAGPSRAGAEAITSPRWILSVHGMPAILLGNEPGRRALALRLRLSPEQIERLDRINGRFERQTKTVRYDLLQKRIEMQRLFSDPASNQALLLSRQKEFATLFAAYADQAAKAAIEARAVLTPEQIERLDPLLQR
jgi:Spy/CpxP family protein refolding chaperone